MNIRKLILALAATASVGFVACNESNTAQATQNAATVTQAVVATNASAAVQGTEINAPYACLLYTSPSPRDQRGSRMPSSA